MDLPKILLTGLVFLIFLVFLEFLDSWAWDSKNLEKNQINQKKQKKQSWMWQDCFFCFFLVFLEFLDSWGLGHPKTSRKTRKTKRTKKTIWNRLTPDSSHRIVFFVSFWFSLTFWTYGKVEMKKGKKHEKTKDAKTQRSQRPFLIIYRYIYIYTHIWYTYIYIYIYTYINKIQPSLVDKRLPFAIWQLWYGVWPAPRPSRTATTHHILRVPDQVAKARQTYQGAKAIEADGVPMGLKVVSGFGHHTWIPWTPSEPIGNPWRVLHPHKYGWESIKMKETWLPMVLIHTS